MLDGFYVGYMSGQGYGVVLFVFKGNSIVGVDAGGVKFDGNFEKDGETKEYRGKVTVSAPPNIELIQGIRTGDTGLKYDVSFALSENFTELPFARIDTPLGPVNIKLEKVRDLGAVA
jgi:hypothetical protein